MRAVASVVVLLVAIAAGGTGAAADCPLPIQNADARQHCDAGAVAYAAGDFAVAAHEFELAHQIQAEPGLLYAWAQARRLGGACDAALELYRRYLETEPNEAQRTATDGWIAECEKTLGIEHPTGPIGPDTGAGTELPGAGSGSSAPPEGDVPVEPPGQRWYSNRLGLGLAIGGAIGIGVGTGFLVAATRSDARARDAEFLDDHNAALAEARSRRRVGFVALGAGVALAIGSALTYVIRSKRDPEPAVALGVDGDGATVLVRGSF
jgi:hypothetical protein